MTKKYLFCCFSLIFFSITCLQVSAQKVLQIEKYGKAKTEKLFIGHSFYYKVRNDDAWRFAYIEDLVVDQNMIQLGRIYVPLGNIEAIRYDRKIGKNLSRSVMIFGLSWSGFAAIGTATDGNPDTRYRWSDAIVTGTSMLIGGILPKMFKYKTIRFGKKKRLRMLDLEFKRIRP